MPETDTFPSRCCFWLRNPSTRARPEVSKDSCFNPAPRSGTFKLFLGMFSFLSNNHCPYPLLKPKQSVKWTWGKSVRWGMRKRSHPAAIPCSPWSSRVNPCHSPRDSLVLPGPGQSLRSDMSGGSQHTPHHKEHLFFCLPQLQGFKHCSPPCPTPACGRADPQRGRPSSAQHETFLRVRAISVPPTPGISCEGEGSVKGKQLN